MLHSIIFHSKQGGSCVGVSLWFASSGQQLSAPLTICSQLQLVSSVVHHGVAHVRGTCITVWHLREIRFAGKVRQKFWCKIHDERVPSRQTIHILVNKLRTMGLLKKQKHKHTVLTEKLHYLGARLECTPRKSLKCSAQQTGRSKSSARTQLKPSSESWCLVCCKCKKECCTHVL
jgi:hypothetical protein